MAIVAFPNPTTFSPQCPTLPDGGKIIIQSDTDTYAQPVAVYAGDAGVVVCTPANGGIDVPVPVVAGGMVPFRVTAVKQTGTTATLLFAVY